MLLSVCRVHVREFVECTLLRNSWSNQHNYIIYVELHTVVHVLVRDCTLSIIQGTFGPDWKFLFPLLSGSASFPLCCADESTKDETVLSADWLIIIHVYGPVDCSKRLVYQFISVAC